LIPGVVGLDASRLRRIGANAQQKSKRDARVIALARRRLGRKLKNLDGVVYEFTP
jgi:hypothetical protein